jgi:hypothetical protein
MWINTESPGLNFASAVYFYYGSPIAGFVPSAGTSTGQNGFVGPLSVSNGSLSSYQTIGTSIRVTPTTSANNSQGNYQLGYFQDTGFTGAPIITQAMLMTCPFYQSGNSMCSYRMIRIPDDN